MIMNEEGENVYVICLLFHRVFKCGKIEEDEVMMMMMMRMLVREEMKAQIHITTKTGLVS